MATDPAAWSARSLVWRDGHVQAQDVDPTELIDLLGRDEATQAWWCLPRAEGPGLTAAAEFLGLDVLAVEDILGTRETPKLDTIGDTVMIIGGGVRFDPEEATLEIDRVSILATKRALVLVADELLLSTLVPVLQRLRPAGDDRGDRGRDSRPAGRPGRRLQRGPGGDGRGHRDAHRIALRRQAAAPRRPTACLPAAPGARPAPEGLRPDGGGHRRTGRTPLCARPTSPPPTRSTCLLATPTARRFADVADHARHAAEGTTDCATCWLRRSRPTSRWPTCT